MALFSVNDHTSFNLPDSHRLTRKLNQNRITHDQILVYDKTYDSPVFVCKIKRGLIWGLFSFFGFPKNLKIY